MKKKKKQDKIKSSIYKCYKNTFYNIINDEQMKKKINDAIIRTNKITTRTYMVLRLFLIKNFNENINLFNNNDKENINKLDNIIRDIHTVICKEGQGKRRIVLDEFRLFYNNEYQQDNDLLLNKVNLNQSLNYEIDRIITCYKNSIISNFFNNLFRFINCMFDYKTNEEFIKLTNKDKIKEFKKQHFKELKQVKNDLLKNTLTSDQKYHKWINKYKNLILPNFTDIDDNYHYDIKLNPLNYLKYMIYMSSELENNEKKQFQCIPMRTNITTKHIDIDTKSLIELSSLKNKDNYLSDIKNNKEWIWKQYFDMNNKCFKIKNNYRFNYRIITDGVSVSLCFIRKDKYGKRKNKQPKPSKDYIEFPHIDEIDYDLLKKLYKDTNFVYVDPGKNNILYMMDNNKVFFRYTNKQRIKETERLETQEKLNKIKESHKIKEIETELSSFNSKTCNYNKFKEYISKKEDINNRLYDFYNNLSLRKAKRRRNINTQRSEANLINNIKKQYEIDNKKITIIYGSWNITKQMRNFISTPNTHIKKLLAKHFKVLTLDEFRTSCLNYKTNEKVENMKIYNKQTEKHEKIHKVLILTEKNNVSFCISRDRNAVYNFKKITLQYLKDKTRPYNFRRNVKI